MSGIRKLYIVPEHVNNIGLERMRAEKFGLAAKFGEFFDE